MNELKFNSKVCTTKEQSQRLLELGLKPETADMYHTTFYRDNVGYEIIQVRNEKLPLLSQETPAWSLHRLMLICAEYYLSLHLNIKNIRLYDHIIDIIENLIKLEKIDKKYLQ